jgi:Putative zinc- or iron-chelating domain
MGEARRVRAAGMRFRPFTMPRAPSALTRLVIPAGAPPPSDEAALEAVAVAETVRERVRAHLLHAAATGRVDRMRHAIDAACAECVAQFEAALQSSLVANLAHRAAMDRVQCRRGCAFCCYVEVAVTPLEAIRLAGRARPATPASASSHRAPCPLLADGACSVYERRPFACRSIFSEDAHACAAGYEGAGDAPIPSLHWPRFLSCGYVSGAIAALDDLGLASHLVRLRSALAVLDGDPTALVRWLNGADVFPPQDPP